MCSCKFEVFQRANKVTSATGEVVGLVGGGVGGFSSFNLRVVLLVFQFLDDKEQAELVKVKDDPTKHNLDTKRGGSSNVKSEWTVWNGRLSDSTNLLICSSILLPISHLVSSFSNKPSLS